MTDTEKQAKKYDRMADLIAGDPEWYAFSDEIDDSDLVDALRIAADYLREKS